MFFFSKILIEVNKNAKLQINSISNVKKIIEDLK